jgi:serine phosphatase RsbU (regulator of sigma subunit)
MDAYDESAPTGARAGAIAALSLVLLALLFPLSRWNYLLFHSVTESFSTLVALGIFVIAWNTRKFNENPYLSVLGCGLLFTGFTTLIHMLAYKGMGVFPAAGANLPTQLWIISRLFAAASFLVAGLSLRRRVSPNAALAGFGLVWLLLMGAVFVWPVFPVMFGEAGLTPLKVALEYLVVALLAVAGWRVWSSRGEFDSDIARMLLVAIGLMIAAELAFTLYTDVFGVLNFLGHGFALVGNIVIYSALIDAALTRPYSILFRELGRREREERRISDTLQAALLSAPDRIESVAMGYAHQSATSGALVGGDFYDLFAPAPGMVAFVIGDVCGKGVEAAAATAMVRTMMRSFAFEDCSPEEVLRRTNAAVGRELPEDKFVTAVYGVIESATGMTRVAGAGHPDPVVRDTEGAHVLRLPRNPPLGVVSDQSFAEVREVMTAGEMIVLYTDGLLDAGREAGGFGCDRIVEGVRRCGGDPTMVAASLLSEAVAFAEGTLSDDVAVVALRFLPASAPIAEGYVP